MVCTGKLCLSTATLMTCVALLPDAAVAMDNPDAARVAKLVQQLNANRLEDRSAAVRELESLGPAVLPRLPAESAVDDAAVRDALSQLRRLLERQLAAEAALPARLTLSGERSAAELVAEVTRQTGNPIHFDDTPVAPPSMAVRWDRVPFWTAVADVCRATGRQPQWSRTAGWQLVVPQPEKRELGAAVAGPLRVAVRELAWKKLPSGKEQLLRLGLLLQAEPRLRPLFVTVRPGDWTVDAGEQRFTAWNPTATYELPFSGDNREVSWVLDLLAPTGVALSAPWSLTGKARLHLAAGAEPFVFEASTWERGGVVQRGGVVRRGGVTVRLRSATTSNDDAGHTNLSLRLTVSYAVGGPAFESHRLGFFQQSAWLMHDDGTTVPFAAVNALAEADGGIALEYRFARLAHPPQQYRFVYEAPALLLDAPFDVQLKQLPLPSP